MSMGKQMTTLEELGIEVEKKIREAAILEERNRIMKELLKADLPVGIWSAIKDIINPKAASKLSDEQELIALIESVPSEKILGYTEDRRKSWNSHCDLVNQWKKDNLKK